MDRQFIVIRVDDLHLSKHAEDRVPTRSGRKVYHSSRRDSPPKRKKPRKFISNILSDPSLPSSNYIWKVITEQYRLIDEAA